MQNVILVASSAVRTLSYIDAYGMTLWRLSGLIWMGLVAAGLIWIALRLVTKRGHLWLVNANLATTFLALMACGFTDFKSIVADWNVDKALASVTVHSQSQVLSVDGSYLVSMGPSALPALRVFPSIARRAAAPPASRSPDGER